jgi:hypothetical protein
MVLEYKCFRFDGTHKLSNRKNHFLSENFFKNNTSFQNKIKSADPSLVNFLSLFKDKNSNILKKILPLFSYVLHPIFIPLLAGMFYLFLNESQFATEEKLFIFFQILIVTVCIPMLFFLLLRAVGKIDSIMVAEVSQRKLPLILHCFLIILLIRKSITLDRYPELHCFFLGALLSSMIALILLFFNIKASLHMIAISSLTLFVIGLSLHFQTQSTYTIAFLILLNGIVASSRLEMKAHTNKELIIGFLLGSISQLLLLFLWL